MSEEVVEKTPKPWVKLHLAKQSDSCRMPPWVVGMLQQELPGAYLLGSVLEMVPDDGHPLGYIWQERKFPDYISRTYVYRVEILGAKPDLMMEEGPYLPPSESSFG